MRDTSWAFRRTVDTIVSRVALVVRLRDGSLDVSAITAGEIVEHDHIGPSGEQGAHQVPVAQSKHYS